MCISKAKNSANDVELSKAITDCCTVPIPLASERAQEKSVWEGGPAPLSFGVR